MNQADGGRAPTGHRAKRAIFALAAGCAALLVAGCGGGTDTGGPDAEDQSGAWVQVAATQTAEGSQVRFTGTTLEEIDEARFEDGSDLLGLIKAGIAAGRGEIELTTDGFAYVSQQPLDADGIPVAGKLSVVRKNSTDLIDFDVVQTSDAVDEGRMFAAATKKRTCMPKLGKIYLPTNNKITCVFGKKCASSWGGLHTGQDFGGGGPVYAMADGHVVSVVRDGAGDHGLGNTLLIAHRSGCASPLFIISMYSHLDSIDSSMKRGTIVKAGRVIGQAGETGVGTGKHLHFEVKLVATLSNPFGVGKANEGKDCKGVNAKPGVCFGYTRLDPAKYGYLDPEAYLRGAVVPNQSIF